jgi:hypothetical protein
MKSNDQKLLEEAYISALQKSINVPADDITVNQPDTPAAVEMHSEPEVVTDITSDGPASDEHYQMEEKEETSMAAANLFSIFNDAKMLHDVLKSGGHLETWMLQKIAVVADNLSGVAKVAKYDIAKGE